MIPNSDLKLGSALPSTNKIGRKLCRYNISWVVRTPLSTCRYTASAQTIVLHRRDTTPVIVESENDLAMQMIKFQTATCIRFTKSTNCPANCFGQVIGLDGRRIICFILRCDQWRLVITFLQTKHLYFDLFQASWFRLVTIEFLIFY